MIGFAQYTNADIEYNLEKKKKLGKTLGNLGSEQTRVAIAVQAARDSVNDADRQLTEAKLKLMEAGDNDDVHALNKAVKDAQELLVSAQESLRERQGEEKRLQREVEDRKRRLKARSRDRDWAKVNQRALEENQRADRQANSNKGSNATTAAEVGGINSNKGGLEFNPYARRKAKPKILWDVGQDEDKVDTGKEEKDKSNDGKLDKPDETQGNTNNQETEVILPLVVAGDEDDDRPEEDEEDDAPPPSLVHESSSAAGDTPNKSAQTTTYANLMNGGGIDDDLASGRDHSMIAASLVAVGAAAPESVAAALAKKRQRVRKGLSLDEYFARKENGTL